MCRGDSTRLLIVEDEDLMRKTLVASFLASGYAVDAVATGEDCLDRTRPGRYDLILLDLILPGISGFQVVKELRADGVNTPLIILSGCQEEEGLIRSLDLGADEFVRKPFSMPELAARVRACIRRELRTSSPVLSHGDLELDLVQRVARRNGETVRLTDIPFRLLRALVERRGVVATRQELYEEVWGMSFEPETKILEVQITYLRQRLGVAGPSPIENIRRVGYRLLPADSS